MRHIVRLLLALAISGGVTEPAGADIVQQITFTFDSDPSTLADDDTNGDHIEGQTDADINRALLAGISGFRYEASGSVSAFGSYGVAGRLLRTGELHSQVYISADVPAPPFGVPRPSAARFIIDGGSFNLIAGPNSTLDYTLTLSVDRSPVFQSWGNLIIDPGGGSPTFIRGGSDIGATQDPRRPTIVEIPLSFQTVDLGVLNPGQSIYFEYQLDVVANVPQNSWVEGILFNFQDPLTLSPLPVPVGSLRPSIIEIPEPSSVLLLAVASAVLGIMRKAALRATAPCQPRGGLRRLPTHEVCL
jgi:hypothetical protein